MFARITKLAGLALVALILFAGVGAGRAEAGGYRYVTTYDAKVVPYEKTIVCYDHCGRPYYKTIAAYKKVVMPVRRRAYCD